MPKDTFYNLDESKREKIVQVLSDEFSNKPFKDASVKKIVERLGIARGSFYQYFEDLEESYFFILDKEINDTHTLFMNILKDNGFDIFTSLEEFGNEIADLIFENDKYNIYKNRYLFWNDDLETRWNKYHQVKDMAKLEKNEVNLEVIHFIKAVVHSLIKRVFKENLSKKDFIKKYLMHIKWIKEGVNNENI